MAIRSWSIQHRDLIERWGKAQRCAFGEEHYVVRMTIGVRDQRTKRIEPPKATGIFIRQATSTLEKNGRSSPGVRGIVMSRRKSHDGNTSAHSYAIKSFALEEVVRRGVDNCGTGDGQAVRRRRVQRQRFEDQQVAPPPGNHITCGATHGELDEHVTSVNEGPKLRTLAARRRSGRVSGDRCLRESRMIVTRHRRDVERLPAGKRFIPNNEIARYILTAPGHRGQNVMIRPIGETRGQPQIKMTRGEKRS